MLTTVKSPSLAVLAPASMATGAMTWDESKGGVSTTFVRVAKVGLELGVVGVRVGWLEAVAATLITTGLEVGAVLPKRVLGGVVTAVWPTEALEGWAAAVGRGGP